MVVQSATPALFLLVANTLVMSDAAVVTLSFTVIGQPNIAVGFLDIDPSDPTRCPVHLGKLTAGAGSVSNLTLVCSGASELTLTHGGATQTFTGTQETSWTFDARQSTNAGTIFNPAAGLMVDVMYDATFDGEDPLQGRFTVASNNTFLAQKYEWVTGTGQSLNFVRTKNAALKSSIGGCPMLRRGHKRIDDIPGGETLHGGHLKRHNFLKYYIAKYMGSVVVPPVDTILAGGSARRATDGWQQVLSAYRRGDQTDLSMLENAQNETFDELERYRHRYQCLAPFFPTQRAQLWVEDAVATQGHYNKVVSYANSSSNKGIRLQLRKVFDATLPPMSGFPKPDINKLVPSSMQLEPTAYDIAALAFRQSITWWTGKAPHEDDVNLFAGWVFPSGHVTPNVNFSRTNHLYANLRDSTKAGGERLAKHLMSSPVWELIWPVLEGLKHRVNRDDFLYGYAPILTLASIGNVVAPASQMIQRFRTDVAARDVYRQNPRKFIHEWLRVRGGAQPVYALTTEPQQYPVTYQDLKDGMKTKATTFTVNDRFHQRLDPVSANRDPSKFRAPNSFNPNRTDWMHGLSVASIPLWHYYKSAPGDTVGDQLETDATGAYSYAPDYTKPAKLKNWCSGYWMAMQVFEDVVTLFLNRMEQQERTTVCRDREREVSERFGEKPKLAPESSNVCMWAAARIDVRFGPGQGCKRLGETLCCATCAGLDQTGSAYMHVLRSVFFIMAKEDQFTWLTPYTFEYFLHTQKYFDAKSEVRVPRVSGVNKVYKGAESILEYYTLQGASFNPSSYRHYGDLYEVTDDAFVSEADGLRMRQLHLDAQVNNGVQFNDDFAKWPDFSHAVFDNTSAYMPFRLLFHDFRPLDVRIAFNPQNRALINSFGTTWEFCQMLQERCYGKNRQFESMNDCIMYMKKIPEHKMGWCPTFAGNTLSCRWMHSILAQEDLRPDIHCFHMGPNKPDPKGNVKCHDDECGMERQGPWVCDKDGCVGEYTHSGTVVEGMHVCFWSLAVLWGVVGMAITHHRLKKYQITQLSSINILGKALAFLKVFTVVAIIHWVVYVICVVGKPNLLYRKPPIESLEPRFIETAKPEERFKSYQYTGDYAAAYTEPFMSLTNTYILNHLMFYMLLMGTCSMVVISEWIGHHFYLGFHDGEILGSEIPMFGHAAFVLAVSVSLLTHPSVMTVLVFILGITKVGYPETLINCWLAFGVAVKPPGTVKDYVTSPTTAIQGLAQLAMIQKKFGYDEVCQMAAATIQKHWRACLARKMAKDKNTAHFYESMFDSSHRINDFSWLKYGECMRVSFFVCQFSAAVGLMLHHFTMVIVFLAGFLASSTYTATNQSTYTAGLRGVLFLVLLQHVVSLLAHNEIVRTCFLLPIEIVFQWYSFANIGETGSNLLSCSIFNLAMSHWFMTPIIVYNLLRPLCSQAKAVADDGGIEVVQENLRQEDGGLAARLAWKQATKLVSPADRDKVGSWFFKWAPALIERNKQNNPTMTTAPGQVVQPFSGLLPPALGKTPTILPAHP